MQQELSRSRSNRFTTINAERCDGLFCTRRSDQEYQNWIHPYSFHEANNLVSKVQTRYCALQRWKARESMSEILSYGFNQRGRTVSGLDLNLN